MAGLYPDVPDHRIAYDRDGTAVTYVRDSGSIVEMTAAQKQGLNNETQALKLQESNGYLAFIFPEPRDIAGYYIAFERDAGPGQVAGALEKSADTTNGQDGTWTSVVNPFTKDIQPIVPDYRSAIATQSITGVKAIRFRITAGGDGVRLYACHVFGKIAAGQTSFLRLWHPTLDQEVAGAHFDWGSTPRGSSADKTFRVKNTHGSLTANSITISLEALTDTTPSVPGQFLVSTDGITFAASVNIGNLAPGAVSGALYVRRNTASNAILGVWTARLLAIAGSWT